MLVVVGMYFMMGMNGSYENVSAIAVHGMGCVGRVCVVVWKNNGLILLSLLIVLKWIKMHESMYDAMVAE